MGAATDKNGQMVSRGAKKLTLAAQLLKMKPEIAKALPKHLDADRMTRITLTALRANPELALCTYPSFLGSVLQLAQLGLEPNTPLGEAYLIPRKIDNVMTCTTIIGYQGMLDIAYRSGKVEFVYAHVVRSGDVFDYDLGLNRKLEHKATGEEEDAKTHVYAVAELKSGHKAFVVLTASQVHRRMASARTGKYSPWTQHEDAMWQKTAVRELFKYLPKSADLAAASAFDEAPEYGRSQTSVLDERVHAALAENSIDVESTEAPALEAGDGVDA